MYDQSVALTEHIHQALVAHLLREDGQEDICLAVYAASTGAQRTTRILNSVQLPGQGDRVVHGNATIMGAYVLRIATQAGRRRAWGRDLAQPP